MKKTLVTLLALVFVLSIASAALAAPANPFVDVPAKHWAYGAVTKLAKAGIVDGYGDGTFRGDRTMTRYEMAQIVAKAMAKSEKADAEMKALIDKLAVEFAAELNNLGVRVAKLEAKTNVSWTFESRLRWAGDSNKADDKSGSNAFDFRQRVYLAGAVNDKVSYGARVETGNVAFGSNASTSFGFDRMFFNIKDWAGIDQITIGRFSTIGITNGLLNGKTANNDGILVTEKMGDVTAKVFHTNQLAQGQVNMINFDIPAGKDFTFNVGYMTTNLKTVSGDNYPVKPGVADDLRTNSLDIGAKAKLGDFWVTGEYVSTKLKSETPNETLKAWGFQITNGVHGNFFTTANIVNPMKPHTDAFAINYRDVEWIATPWMSSFRGFLPVMAGSKVGNNASGIFAQDWNVKGWGFQYQNVLSKGLVFTVDYFDLKSKELNQKDKIYDARLEFYF